ncbi:glucosaminidase domain-containing protein [Neobacillus sp. WH10]|uniref:glucosaminidase domain-containing protein n=1 Tax=Neobacillus sp. WH10 TaxID=3047873 RepID=UPI0024C16A71|nr:glucosaminidase domain-containing protein [Neobacillus sp. WH10]WHY76934.1 glucosaminidase domain-containing protein [Neobacillus sp. WH10]
MKKKRVTAFVLASMLFSSTASGVTAAGTYTWKYQNNQWYYLTSAGKPVTGWVLYGNKWYFLDSNGVMKTGWLLYNNKWYYLDSSGAMKTGWVPSGNKWYFLDSSGAMKTGWLSNGGKWYFLDQSGAMKTGWFKENNTWYFLDPSGAMKTGWFKENNTWYFLEPSGAMKTGWLEDGNVKYYLSSSGAMVTGQKFIDGIPYVFTTSGALSTAPLTGFFRDGQIIMYFDSNGEKHKGWLTEGTNKYYFSDNGFALIGWLTENGKKYYFGQDGKMKTGWVLDANKWFYMNADGTMATGWVYANGKWYFMNENGIMQTGWLLDNGAYYYLNKNGDMAVGWLFLGGNWYYLAGNGKMVTGEQVIDGKTYYFFDNGVWNSGPITKTTNYNLTFQQMLDIQMQRSPQTDKYKNAKAYVSSDYVLVDATDPTKGVVTSTTPLNVREDTNTNSFIFGTLSPGSQVQIVSKVGTWYEIKYVTWRNAKASDVSYFLNPNSFSTTSTEYFQFLLLNKGAGTTAQDLNAKTLAGKGILEGKADAFLEASKKYNINEIYLISHALLETGNGNSALAQGIIVDTVDGKKLDQPVKVYNMYGIGAIDSCPNTCGAETAYKKGWFTPEAAIIGGAEFIGAGYINASTPQNTLYKMRWNPDAPWHQYATDIGWAVKQTNSIKKIYDSLSSYTLYFDVSVYK